MNQAARSLSGSTYRVPDTGYGLDDDNYVGPFLLGFDFPFYDAIYGEFYIAPTASLGSVRPPLIAIWATIRFRPAVCPIISSRGSGMICILTPGTIPPRSATRVMATVLSFSWFV